MPAKVTLTIVKGEPQSFQFVFDERNTCIIGRAEDCEPRLPTDDDHKTISRHHCLLDINPPDIRIRDFGSRNGTYINGQLIGKREAGQSIKDAQEASFPEHDLKDGDEIRLGRTIFRVSVSVPVRCVDCSTEIADDAKHVCERSPGMFRCDACQTKAVKPVPTPQAPASPKKKKLCAHCSKDVGAEVGDKRTGEFVCAVCKADPIALVKMLLGLAATGKEELLAIKGYSVEKELGRGGMGAVYLARHNKSGERVALKVMLPQVAADERAKDAFMREINNTKALQHRHVVALRDSGCSSGTFFFTIEFCNSGSVDRLMRSRGGKLPIDDAMPIILNALDGLAYAHQAVVPHVRLADGTTGRGRGLVHRDIKPQNLFLTGSGASRIAKLGDYGLAKAFDLAGLSGHTRTGTAAGTPVFMPRQQIINFKFAKPEVDVWAIAASLYNMLTGQLPRDFPANKDPWQIVLQTEPIPIRKRDSSIPKRLAEVIDFALVDKPLIRMTSAAELKDALEGAL